MVKFGRHLNFFLDNEHRGSDLYVVPYNKLRDVPPESFHDEWIKCFESASADFQRAMKKMWSFVFDKLSDYPESRGVLPNEALTLFLSKRAAVRPVEVQELLAILKDIQATATVNAEALRKSVKKFDKQAKKDGREAKSPVLLPELYSGSFTTSFSMVDSALELVRCHLDEEETDIEDEEHPKRLWQRQESGDVDKRRDERFWLRNLLSTIPLEATKHIVAHRGFHNPKGKADRRPVENSLPAYEAAWTSGIELCECDIALTKDEKIILAHDEDFSRLALDSTSPDSVRKVRDLTLREIIALPLKSGARPPLLIDVLQSARAIGGNCKLIVEIKPGNSEVATALPRMFQRHPELLEHCAAIMSFDAFAMQSVRREFNAWLTPGRNNALQIPGISSPRLSPELIPPASPTHLSLNGDTSTTALGGGTKSTLTKPRLYLLTVSNPPEKPHELWVNTNDLSHIDGWLAMDDGSLDGVYLQFEPHMLTDDGASNLRELAKRYDVGVWGLNGQDPDDWETFHWLTAKCGASYVNSDLPRNFMKKSMEPVQSDVSFF